ncbi:MAG TPA: NnrU family protein [Alphaproteobacteria bacterium]|nr:NnrU family protein [Alphaproteobacteria bacterium]
MIGSIEALTVAGCVLLLTHFGVSSTGLRDRIVDAIGEGPYLGLYSLVALGVLVWLVMAYNAAPPGPVLWNAYPWGWYVPIVVVPVALVLLVGGLSIPNPTAVGGDRQLAEPQPVRGVLRITRHPVMWAIGLWAIAHTVPNGDLASLLFFGFLGALALLGTLFIDAKNRKRRGAAFAPFELATSNLPFLAVAQRRQDLGRAVREFGVWRLVVVVVLYAALLHGHRFLFGAVPFPSG